MPSTPSRPKKSPSSNKAINYEGHEGPKGKGTASRTSGLRVLRALRSSKGIEAATEIVPLWVAESMVQEVSVWLDADLPEDWPAALAAKAEQCFARHAQFRRLVSSNRNSGNAGIEALRRFMRHWLASWLKRTRPALFRRLPWSYALGAAPR